MSRTQTASPDGRPARPRRETDEHGTVLPASVWRPARDRKANGEGRRATGASGGIRARRPAGTCAAGGRQLATIAGTTPPAKGRTPRTRQGSSPRIRRAAARRGRRTPEARPSSRPIAPALRATRPRSQPAPSGTARSGTAVAAARTLRHGHTGQAALAQAPVSPPAIHPPGTAAGGGGPPRRPGRDPSIPGAGSGPSWRVSRGALTPRRTRRRAASALRRPPGSLREVPPPERCSE